MGLFDLIDTSNGYAGYTSYASPTISPTGAAGNNTPVGIYAAMGLSAFSSILTTMGEARALKAQADYEQMISRTNANIARIQAKQTIEEGDEQASKVNQVTRQREGEQIAEQAGSGISVNSGSNLLKRIGTEAAGAQDELTIRNNAQRRAWGFKMDALEESYKGEFAQLTAKSKVNQTLINGGLEAVSGPLAIESNYLRFSKYKNGAPTSRLPFEATK